jgi:hypothetical protein
MGFSPTSGITLADAALHEEGVPGTIIGPAALPVRGLFAPELKPCLAATSMTKNGK